MQQRTTERNATCRHLDGAGRSTHAAAFGGIVRPLLLLQCRDDGDPMRDHEVECFERALSLESGSLVTVDATTSVPDRSLLQEFSAVLMGGSGDYSTLDELPWIDDLVRWCDEELLPARKPTFASCFGFQILIRAVGGTMMRDSGNTEFGTYDLALTELAAADPIFGTLPATFCAQVGHSDRAAALPANVQCLASTPLCPTHAFRIAGLPIWATQFHPELRMEDLATRYRHYGHYTAMRDGEVTKPELRPSPGATMLLANFGRWVAQAEALADTSDRG
jgi:GMP synthase (glutamine-hydrolysing)